MIGRERDLPRGFRWEMQLAKRKSKKGRAMGGIVVEIRRGIKVERGRAEEMMEGMMMVEIRLGKERWRWRLVGMYINGDLEEKLEKMRGWMEGMGTRTVIGGDFNARTGEGGGGDGG